MGRGGRRAPKRTGGGDRRPGGREGSSERVKGSLASRAAPSAAGASSSSSPSRSSTDPSGPPAGPVGRVRGDGEGGVTGRRWAGPLLHPPPLAPRLDRWGRPRHGGGARLIGDDPDKQCSCVQPRLRPPPPPMKSKPEPFLWDESKRCGNEAGGICHNWWHGFVLGDWKWRCETRGEGLSRKRKRGKGQTILASGSRGRGGGSGPPGAALRRAGTGTVGRAISSTRHFSINAARTLRSRCTADDRCSSCFLA